MLCCIFHLLCAISLPICSFVFAEKLLLALQAVRRCHAVAPQHPSVLSATVRLFHLVDQTKDINPTVASVIKLERDALLGNKDLASVVKSFAASDIAARTAVAETSVLLGLSDKPAAIKSLMEAVAAQGSVQDFVAAHQLISSWDAAAAASFKEAVHAKRLPYSSYFGSTPIKVEEEVKDD